MSKPKSSLFSVIAASSAGTMIEWYDFYIFGSLATIISTKFFPDGNPTLAFLSTLATFAAGFVVRPFGAIFFGRLGDIVGRKHTFMLTLMLMGGATFMIGCVPTYEQIGILAPMAVLLLRLLQGLALGGEYGGAATYVAEHAPDHARGYMTSWIQTTATVGLFVSLLVIMVTRNTLSPEQFDEWGWRVPFWISILMVGISYLIRKNMDESPLFAKAKAEGITTTNPIKESFGRKSNFKYVLLALFGAVMGQGVVWYTGQFYAMSFMEKLMSISKIQVDEIMFIALILGTPFFVFFGWLSDKIGRKWIMMIGMLLAIMGYRPIYQQMYSTTASATQTILTSEEITKANFTTLNATDSVHILNQTYTSGMKIISISTPSKEPTKTVTITSLQKWQLIWWIWLQVIFVTMVYGPIAAFLVEMFPTEIRYTSMSLPYHIGNGIFGGLLPAVATYMATSAKTAGDVQWYLAGLWYPISVATVCLVIGVIYLPSRPHNSKNSL